MRALNWLSGFIVSAALALIMCAPASACDFQKGPIFNLMEEWTKTCNHPLCGRIHIAESSRLKEHAKNCEWKGWMSMREDVRATVVAGGVVLFGEQHDNPLHHELRSRVGFSSYASAVFEQIPADKAAALDAFLQSTNYNYKSDSLEKLKAAIDWDKSGWNTYNYDPLLIAALKGQVPFYAGDADRETIKKVAKDGPSALPDDVKTRLKLDVDLGEKADSAVLDELYESHCKQMPRETLGSMAFAQRYRDAVLADVALMAVEKRRSTLLIAGNEHVRKDRGVPWYIHQRAPEMKTLSIMMMEVEDGKTDPEAYVPRDAEGKPAVDYIIFTPRAEHKDHCAEMKKD
ncbi:MAG: ChaN family lipoprotein [Hyphomicrobium sp.]